MERVGWHPVGMYEKRRAKSATFCYTLIIIALLAGTVAVVVSWLLATGVIDPDKRQNFKEARRLDVFRDLNSLEADIRKVSFPSKPTPNVTKPLTTTEMPEKMEVDTADPGTESKTENIIAVSKEPENKAVTEATTDIEEIEKAILKQIETEVLIDQETVLDSFIGETFDEAKTETIRSISTTYNTEGQIDDPETTTISLRINEDVTEVSSTTVIKEIKEEEIEIENSTEPFTVPTLTNIEETKEDDETIVAVTLVDILTGKLETTTFIEISEVETTTEEK